MKVFFKILYQRIPFKGSIYKLLRRVFSLPKAIYKHLHFNGVINVKVDKQNGFEMQHYGFQLENDIFWSGLFGGWEKDSLKIWHSLAKSSEVIFDVGANTGIYSLLAKCVNPNARVYAFDPVERVYEKLVKNIEINNYDIVAEKLALSNFDGEAVIYDDDSEHTYSVAVNKNVSVGNQSLVEVPISVMKFSTYIEQKKLNKIDLVKIDVETHELEVLNGMEDYLKRYKPNILIEVLNDEIGNGILKLFTNLDYDFYEISEMGSVRLVESINAGIGRNYLLHNKKSEFDIESII